MKLMKIGFNCLCAGLMLSMLAGSATVHAAGAPKETAVLSNLPGDVRGLTFSPNGRLLAISTGLIIKLWDWQANKELALLNGGLGAAFSNDGTLIAFPGQNEYNTDGLMVWDIAAKKPRCFIADDNVKAPVFSPDGKNIAAAVGGKIKIWELASQKEMAPLTKDGHKCSINALAYVLDGKRIVSGDGRGVVILWEVSDTEAKKLAEFKRENNENAINSLSATLTGAWAAAATGDGLIALLDVNDLKQFGLVKAFKEKEGEPTAVFAVKSVSFGPDGRMLASVNAGIEDVEIKLWDAASKRQLVSFQGHLAAVNAVAISPDAKILATGSDDKSVKLWDIYSLLNLNNPVTKKE